MLARQRQDVRAASLPEICRKSSVQVIADADDEGLK